MKGVCLGQGLFVKDVCLGQGLFVKDACLGQGLFVKTVCLDQGLFVKDACLGQGLFVKGACLGVTGCSLGKTAGCDLWRTCGRLGDVGRHAGVGTILEQGLLPIGNCKIVRIGTSLICGGMLSSKYEVIPRTLAHGDIRATVRRHTGREQETNV
ncbi:UNVERIFIED_CONTAM: hypothetical protein Slati_4185700 [Sesamum latifolium]|uniref:Uncharacterized protein n=1 Tax=Sesamum latifolium TaxID=2727402 RepID=A0AAW2TAE8_9LAMI